MRLAWDIETDGFLDNVTRIHCLNILDIDTLRSYRFTDHTLFDDRSPVTRDGTVAQGISLLLSASEWIYHNGINFDEPVIRKLYPAYPEFSGTRHDTLVYSRLIWTNLKDLDFASLRKGKLDGSFMRRVGSHSLGAWGYRLGVLKDEFDPADTGHTWANVPFSLKMYDYCSQDCVVTKALYELIQSKDYSAEAMQLETEVATIISRQQRFGFMFDIDAARSLTATLLVRLSELESQCRTTFDPWFARSSVEVFTPKRQNAKAGYVAGAPLSKVELREFNPLSRDHIASRLRDKYKWVPTEFTPEGKPKVDETVLNSLPYPEAKLLAEYMLVAKRLGQLAEGKEAWLNHVGKDGRIHGSVNTNGAVTGRMTHNAPNIAQVPRVTSPYGAECRALFCVPAGKILTGCDAEGLELRMLAHYMARYDGGAYVQTVVDGKKEDKSDIHSVNQRVVALNRRDSAKTFIYALIYGAGDHKLGSVVLDDMAQSKRDEFNGEFSNNKDAQSGALTKLGKKARKRMMDGLPALKSLTEGVKKAVAEVGYLRGLDGRILHVRAEHSALNTLLQSGGAVVMKKALVLLDRKLKSKGINYEFVANVHDEFQIEVDEEAGEEVGAIAAECIKEAGEYYKLRCPLSGSYAVGRNWKETH